MRTTEFVQVVTSDAEIGRMFNRSKLAIRILGALTVGDNYISEIARICGSGRDHLLIEHQLSNECETIKEIMWFIGESIDGRVTLGHPKPKGEGL